ncbi:hypothetical protein FE391_08305 [Nonomuraea sp. KC401]|uniref:hypothetical protein n=1 Tax=unclassified Nonomuraea TaxID=2593643 RepID=UPI0010FEF286|nr:MULTISPECIES: hypothetical protein [unclassified Nonomuraea]NBE93943.1 hypothetical protein [Nonomuraea sp. K271]TLF80199.1 hypothetical protein FE391_08305 [Nonomuraea sp. KC401]
MVADVLVAVLAGPLVASGVAKLVAPTERLSWPVGDGPLAAPHGPRLVASAELVGAVLLIVVPGRLAAVGGLVAYLALTGVSHALRGQECACFGLARLASVGRTHIVMNAVGASLGAIALLIGPGAQTALRVGVAIAATALITGVVVAVDRRARAVEAAKEKQIVERTDAVYGVQLYTTESCPSCRALKKLVAGMEPARRDAVVETVLGPDDAAPGAMAAMGVPCAQGLDGDGRRVGEPVSGIGSVKALINSIVVTARV